MIACIIHQSFIYISFVFKIAIKFRNCSEYCIEIWLHASDTLETLNIPEILTAIIWCFLSSGRFEYADDNIEGIERRSGAVFDH